ncbi:MAG: hypothetical protein ABIS21_06785, partial [Acidimicrobiales bacterium]
MSDRAADGDPVPGRRSEPVGFAPLVLLAGECPATNVVFHALEERFGAIPVVMEAPMNRSLLVRRRMKKLGLPTVAGQLLFMALVVPVLARRGRARIDAIVQDNGLDLSPIG